MNEVIMKVFIEVINPMRSRIIIVQEECFLQLNELPPVGHFHIGSYFLYAVFGWFRCKSTVYKFNPSLLDHQLSLKMEKAISTTENQGSSMSIFYVHSVVTTWHFHFSKTVLDFMAHKMVQN